jgi:hypothetical protein
MPNADDQAASIDLAAAGKCGEDMASLLKLPGSSTAVRATSFTLFANLAGLLGVDECELSAYASHPWYR